VSVAAESASTISEEKKGISFLINPP